MPLDSGTEIGPYKIITPLGAGGMGEVYRANDPRLGREVAIKVLTQEATAGSMNAARFEREARAVAALNHPNILAVYDFASENGRSYIVTELVNGEPLRERMKQGPIGIRELYRIAVQIADGLSAAHAAGIAHRDIKPENVMITTDGRAKILDFGLARNTAQDTTVSQDDIATQFITSPGMVMGTVAYMSPEQVRAIDAGHTSDQFSFGTMLYEMASGNRPFTRETAAQTMTAILTEEPPPLDSKVPPPLRWTIARCLEKDPNSRFESTRDLYHDLKNQQDHLSDVFTSTELTPVPAPESARKQSRWWLAAIPAIALSLLAGWMLKPAPNTGNLRYTPIEVSLANPTPPVWSPDGKAFSYAAEISGVRQVLLRYLNSPAPTQLSHSPIDITPMGWSADGKRVIARTGSQGKLEFVSLPIVGGDPELLGKESRRFLNADIATDGKAYAVLLFDDSGKFVIETAASPGVPTTRYQPGPFESTDIFNSPMLQISPDNRRLLFVVDEPRGRLAWNIPLPAGGQPPRQVLPGLSNFRSTPKVSWLPDNKHIIVSLEEEQDKHPHLWLANVDSGKRRQLTHGISAETNPAVSPDGSKVLFSSNRARYSLVSVSVENGSATRLLSSDLPAGMPAWALRQDRYVYQTDRNGPLEIWLHADGWDRPLVGPAQFPSVSTNRFMNPSLSPGADRLAYTHIASDASILAYISSVSGGAPARLTNETNVTEISGSWSPDAKQFVYLRRTKSKSDLAIVKTSGDATPTVIRQDVTGRLPDWSPDGKWILCLAKDNILLVSPDGKTERELGIIEASQFTFSKDSRFLYGIRQKNNASQLFTVDIETKNQKVIGEFDKELYPLSFTNPGVRLSLSPDGKSLLFASVTASTSLWMLEGFDPPSWTERLRAMLP